MRGGESFIKLVRQLELQRDDERARTVDVAPATGVCDETDHRHALLPDIDGRETFREVAAQIEGRMLDATTCHVNVLALAVQADARALVAETVGALELRRDHNAPRLVNEAPLVVSGDRVETNGRHGGTSRGRRAERRDQTDEDDNFSQAAHRRRNVCWPPVFASRACLQSTRPSRWTCLINRPSSTWLQNSKVTRRSRRNRCLRGCCGSSTRSVGGASVRRGRARLISICCSTATRNKRRN